MNQLHNKIPILVAEQVAPKLFNKGQLYNIAVEWLGDHLRKNIANTHLASESFGDITLILHDVDILPDAKMYARYSAPDLETPSQMIPITEYFKQIYDPKYPIPVGGGVTAIKMSDYIKVNGFPNHFAGWGGEDNAFQQRLKSNKIYYHYNEIGDFRTTDIQRTDIHSKKKYIDAADIQNKKMNELRMQDRNNWSNSGLNQLSQLNYKINTQKESGLISQIQITCDNNAGGSIGRSIKGATATAAPANISNVTATIDVLIVVPFADFKPEQKRAEQLAKFKKHMAGLIQELNYAGKINIVVAEQISQKNYFNRGQLLNAGIKWYAENIAKPRFVILHDVDMLPDKTLFAQYFKSKSPISLVPQDEDYKKTYGKIILAAGGGIFGLPYVDFIKCNGFPNSFWSWGGEDDAFSRRLANVGVRRFARVKNGHIHHIDVQRESHQTKMDYLRKNQIRSMMVHENLDRDSKEWREDGIADVKAMPKSTQVIGLDDPKVDTVYQVKYELAPTGLDEFISHNERVYKTLDKS